MSSIGPICRYAKDLPIMLKAMVGEENSASLKLNEPVNMRKLRVFQMKGLNSPMYPSVHRDCSAALQKAAKYFEKACLMWLKIYSIV
jgi:fatty acid amide hydrolase 2